MGTVGASRPHTAPYTAYQEFFHLRKLRRVDLSGLLNLGLPVLPRRRKQGQGFRNIGEATRANSCQCSSLVASWHWRPAPTHPLIFASSVFRKRINTGHFHRFASHPLLQSHQPSITQSLLNHVFQEYCLLLSSRRVPHRDVRSDLSECSSYVFQALLINLVH